MKRYVSMEEISDGKLYRNNDMVKADCGGCKGCCDCCKGMGKSIILDPYDIYRLTTGLKTGGAMLIGNGLELSVVDGVILPNLMMEGEEERCHFLNAEGRCSIHALRPGICRLFPLGRVYEEGTFRYFLQTGQCSRPCSKIKVSKWMDTPQLSLYEGFVCTWHYLVKQVEEALTGEENNRDDQLAKQLNMQLLQIFYLEPYEEGRSFYEQFGERKAVFEREMTKRCRN